MRVNCNQCFLGPAPSGGIARKVTSVLASLFRMEAYDHFLYTVYGLKTENLFIPNISTSGDLTPSSGECKLLENGVKIISPVVQIEKNNHVHSA